jgi:hypothetical protein
MTTKLSTQKVSATLIKAGLNIDKGLSMFSSGYSVRGIHNEYPWIEVRYNVSGHGTQESWTAYRVEKITKAAEALTAGGLTVMYIPVKDEKGHSYAHTLFLAKDKEMPLSKTENKILFDATSYAVAFEKVIQREIAESKKETLQKEEKANTLKKAQNERMARVKLLNPSIVPDMTYVMGLSVYHVTMLNGELAVLTVASVAKKEIDWESTAASKEERSYDCFSVEMTATYRYAYDKARWETRSDNFTTKKGETVEDGIYQWLSERY